MLTRYEPWSAMEQLRQDMNRAFGKAMTGAEDGSNVVTSGWIPAVDIREEQTRFVISADIPGVNPDDIEVVMENGMLTIRGERTIESAEEGDRGFRRIERLHGSFYRRFSLPDTADADGISASGKNGVLEVVIPKHAKGQPKRIEVAA